MPEEKKPVSEEASSNEKPSKELTWKERASKAREASNSNKDTVADKVKSFKERAAIQRQSGHYQRYSSSIPDPNSTRVQGTEMLPEGGRGYNYYGIEAGMEHTAKGFTGHLGELDKEVGLDPFAMPKNWEEIGQAHQTWDDVLTRSFTGFVGNFAAQAVTGIGASDMSGLISMAMGDTDKKFGNALTEWGDAIREYTDTHNHIYDSTGSPFTGEYWGKQIQQLGTSYGDVPIVLGEQFLLRGAGKAIKGLSFLKTLTGGKSMLGKMSTMGAHYGIKESYTNALETQKNTYDELKKRGFSEQKAIAIAAEAATKHFRTEAIPSMVLNASMAVAVGGKYNPFKKVTSSPTGISGGMDTLSDWATKGVKNTYAKKAVDYGTAIAGEAAEELFQTGTGKMAQHQTLHKYGLVDRSQWEDIIFDNDEARDSGIGGALGGFINRLFGKRVGKAFEGVEAKNQRVNYSNHVRNITKRVNEDLKEMEELYRKSDNDEDLNKLRRRMQTSTLKEALKFDLMNQEDKAFEEYVSTLKDRIDAAQSGDTKKMELYGIRPEDVEGVLETHPGYIQDAINMRNNLVKNLEVHKDYNIASYITGLEQTLDNLYEYEEKEKQILASKKVSNARHARLDGETRQKVDDAIELETLKYIVDANDKGQSDHKNLDAIKKRKAELEAKVDKDFNPADHVGRAYINNVAQQHASLIANQSEQAYVIDSIKKWSDPKTQQEEYKRVKLAAISEAKTEEALDQLKQYLEASGQFDQKYNAAIEQRRHKINNPKATKPDPKTDSKPTPDPTPQVNEEDSKTIDQDPSVVEEQAKQEVLEEDDNRSVEEINNAISDISNKDISNVPEVVKEETKKFEGVANNLENKEGTQISQEDLDKNKELRDFFAAIDAAPMDVDSENNSHINTINEYAKIIRRANEMHKKNTGVEMTADEMYGTFISAVGAVIGEKHFNLFREAYQQVYPDNNVDWNGLYDKYFGFLNDFKTAASGVDNSVENDQILKNHDDTKKALEENSKGGVFDPETKRKIIYSGRKTDNPIPAIAFRGISYQEHTDGNGNTYYTDSTDKLNEGGIIDLNVILDYDNLVPGKTFQVAIPGDYMSRDIPIWTRNEEGRLVRSTMKFGDWMQKNNIQEGSQEWIDKVPMDMIVDDQNIGQGIRDVDWWNEANTANFNKDVDPDTATKKQQELIQNGKKFARHIRNSVYTDGNNTMKIVNRIGNTTINNKNRQLVSLTDTGALKEIKLGHINEGKAIVIDGVKDTGQLEILNRKEVLKGKGGSAMLVRFGTTVKNGKNVPTYVVYKVHTNAENKQDLMKDIHRNVSRLYTAYDILNKQGNYQNPTPEQEQWAEKVRQGIKKIDGFAGVDIKRGLFGKNYDLRKLYPAKRKNGGGLYMNVQTKNLERMGLPVIDDEGNVTNYESNGETGYKAMLGDTITTQNKFHKITDKNGNEKHVVDVQPKIQFTVAKPEQQKPLGEIPTRQVNEPDTTSPVMEQEPTEVETDEPPVFVDEDVSEDVETTTDDSVKALEQVQPSITSLTSSQKRRVTEYLFHNILHSIANAGGTVNKKDIALRLSDAFDDYINLNPKSPYAQLLQESKDELLGIGDYKNKVNTVKSMIEDFLSLKVDTELDDLSAYEQALEDANTDETQAIIKNFSQESIEMDIKQSLSTELKMFFSGIPKPESIVSMDQIGGIPAFYSPEEVMAGLQDALADIPNDLESLNAFIEYQVEKNPEQFLFLKTIYDRINNKANSRLQNEILYKLGQTKTHLYKVIFDNKKAKTQAIDANSNNPFIRKKYEFLDNFNNSKLIDNNGNSYKIKENYATPTLAKFDEWAKLDDPTEIPNDQLKGWLSMFGIVVDDKTIEDLKASPEFKSNFMFTKNGKGRGLMSMLYANLKTGLTNQAAYGQLSFGNPDLGYVFNILTSNNGGYLKRIIDTDVNNTFNISSNVYDSGKNINAYSQPNFATEQTRKLKEEPTDSNTHAELANDVYSKNSFLGRLLRNNKKVRDNFEIGYVSPQAIKAARGRGNDDARFTSLSRADHDLTLLGMRHTESVVIDDEDLAFDNIEAVMSKMTFPALSDSSSMFVANTLVLDLKEANFEINEETGEVLGIAEPVLKLLTEQLVLPDLQRIVANLQAVESSTIEGNEIGSQLFLTLPFLNSLPVNKTHKTKLLQRVHERALAGESAEQIFKEYDVLIRGYVKNMIDRAARRKFDAVTGTGTWVEDGFVQPDGKTRILDRKFLNDRANKNANDKVKTSIAAYDFVINYYMTQAQIQMLYAGDLMNYVKDKDARLFNTNDDGKPDVLTPNIELPEGANLLEYEAAVYRKLVNNASVNLSKRLKQLMSPGSRLSDSRNDVYYQLMVDDVETSSDTLNELVAMYYPDKAEQYEKTINQFKKIENNIDARASQGKDAKMSKALHKKLRKEFQQEFPLLKDYLEITGTDAQEYTTWKEHLDILRRSAKITDEQYDTIADKLIMQQAQGPNNDNRLSPEEKVFFQPLKPLYAGLHREQLTAEDGTGLGTNQRFVYIKSSSIPLIPEMTHKLKLDNLRKNLQRLQREVGNVRVSYASANKVGALAKPMDIRQLYGEPNDNLLSTMLESGMALNRENFSIQQDKPFKSDDNISKGKEDEIFTPTQMEKIILGNGISDIDRPIFDASLFDPQFLSELGIEPNDNQKITGQDLYQINNALSDIEQRGLRNRLLNRINTSERGVWTGDPDVMETLVDELNQRLSNTQDREILELRYITNVNGQVQSYTKEQIDNSDIVPDYAEFQLPVWLSPNSRSFEPVLYSLVSKALTKVKVPGFSSPVTSQEGFELLDENDFDNEGIIYTPNYDGRLKAQHNKDGSIKYAQVLVPSKFRRRVPIIEEVEIEEDQTTDEVSDEPTVVFNEDLGRYVEKVVPKKKSKKKRTKKVITGYKTEWIDMRQYIDPETNRLDFNKVDPELLKLFSLRIPTSSHQSGAIIEVVGFLPNANADTMVVPKDHTTQLGEDYDIDVRYAMTANYQVDKDGNIKSLDYQDIRNKIAKIEADFLAENNTSAITNDLLSLLSAITEDDDVTAIIQADHISLQRKIEAAKFLIEQKAIQNQKLAIYKSVYTTTDNDVQKSISNSLSTQFAEDTVDIIEKVSGAKLSDDPYFSIFSDEHQRSVVSLGASGKMGIGVHSNWVTYNSMVQQLGPINQFYTKDKDGNVVATTKTFGNFHAKQLGSLTALTPIGSDPQSKALYQGFTPRTISEINMENQNVSADNQKLGVMGKRNENKYTISAFAYMANLGVDKDIIIDKDGNTKSISYPSFFISQPIIRRYVELKAQADSASGKFMTDADIENQIRKEFGNHELNTKENKKKLIEARADITGQRLYNNFSNTSTYDQSVIFEMFLQDNIQARFISREQGLYNIDQGLGLSFFETIDKLELLRDSLNGFDGNAFQILDEDLEPTTEQELKDLEDRGWYELPSSRGYKAKYVRPLHPQARKLVNAVTTNYKLWAGLHPYVSSHQFSQSFSDVLYDLKTNDVDTRYEVMEAMKDFIYSYQKLGLYDKSVTEERKQLFIDDKENNTSLARYLKELKNSKHKLFDEPFFKSLNFQINYDGSPSLVQYNNNDRSPFAKNSVHGLFESLIDSNERLPIDRNGQPYLVKDLINDLVKYAMLANQDKGATGFRQYLPLSVFKQSGVDDVIRKHGDPSNTASHNVLFNGHLQAFKNYIGNGQYTLEEYNDPMLQQYISTIRNRFGNDVVTVSESIGIYTVEVNDEQFSNATFKRQFMQHFPDKVKSISSTSILISKKQEHNGYINSFIHEAVEDEQGYPMEVTNDYLTIRGADGQLYLYEKQQSDGINSVFVRIPILSSTGFNQYDFNTTINESLIPEQNFEVIEPLQLETGTESVNTNQPLNNSADYLNNIIDNNPDLAPLAKLLLDNIDTPAVINTKDLQGLAKGFYLSETGEGRYIDTKLGRFNRGEIYLNEQFTKTASTDEVSNVVMEEILHSITSDALDTYIDAEASYIDDKGNPFIVWRGDERPPSIVKIVQLYKQAIKHIVKTHSEDGNTQEVIARIKEKHQNFKEKKAGINRNDGSPTGSFDNDAYRLLNLKEFIAGVITDPDFRNEMNKVEFSSSKKSILKRMAEVINDIVRDVFGATIKDSISEHTLDATIRLLNMNGKKTKTTKKPKKTDTDKKVESALSEGTTVKPKSNVTSSNKKIRPYFTEERARSQKSFRKKPLVFVNNIKTSKDKPVALRNTGKEILIDFDLLKQKYKEKAWLISATQKDGSKSTPLNENQFNNFDEFLTFVLLHEIKHDSIKKLDNETIGEYEDRINKAALIDLNNNYKDSKALNTEQQLQPETTESTSNQLTQSTVDTIRTPLFTGKITQEIFDENMVMVFGANSVGGHGQGVAALAYANTTNHYKKWNPNLVTDIKNNKVGDFAIAGKTGLTQGIKGKGYGLITKEATIKNNRLVIGKPLNYVELGDNIEKLYNTARENPNLTFVIPYNDNNNFNKKSLNESANAFAGRLIPINVRFGDKMLAEIRRVRGEGVFEKPANNQQLNINRSPMDVEGRQSNRLSDIVKLNVC